jgi:hypothetical protein
MAFTVPTHIQQQFQSMINALTESVGEGTTRAYLKSLCTDASLDSLLGKTCASITSCERPRPGTPPSSGEEDIWKTFTFLNDDNFTDDTDVINNMPRDVIDGDLVSSLASNRILEDLFGVPPRSEHVPTPESRSSATNPDTPFSIPASSSAGNESRTLCDACVCERCTKRKNNERRTGSATVTRSFLRPRLLEFLSKYWETLKVNGLYYHESAQSLQQRVHTASFWKRCINIVREGHGEPTQKQGARLS